MEDYRVVFGILEALSGIVFAWYINHFLIEKKRLADKRENLNKQTGMMLQVAKDWETLDGLIEKELAWENESGEQEAWKESGQKTLDAVDHICNKIPFQIVIDAKQKICLEQGIAFSYEKEFESVRRLDGMDMVSVIGNLFDNAIENCGIQNDHPEISLAIFQKMSQVRIKISNTRQGKNGNGDISRYSTTKQNRLLHGYGLENVQEIVKKHHGTMRITDEKQLFTVEIQMECGE